MTSLTRDVSSQKSGLSRKVSVMTSSAALGAAQDTCAPDISSAIPRPESVAAATALVSHAINCKDSNCSVRNRYNQYS